MSPITIGKKLTRDLTCIWVTDLLGGRASTQAQVKSKATTLLVHHPISLTHFHDDSQLALPKK